MTGDGEYVFHKSPPFLRAKAEQRLALMREQGAVPVAQRLGITVIVTTLTDPEPGVSTEVWNQTCDGCGKYVPQQLYTGHMGEEIDHIPVDFIFGVCDGCKSLLGAAIDE